jgi:hypothetical protein
VRGQTPKVAKQTDKPKRVRGRAKRRLQYNRRFKNIVVGAGGKKKVRLRLLLLLRLSCRLARACATLCHLTFCVRVPTLRPLSEQVHQRAAEFLQL